jgi:hypothetical protein
MPGTAKTGGVPGSGQDLFEEIVPLVVDDDEGREILDRDLEDGLHPELGVDHDLVFIVMIELRDRVDGLPDFGLY